MASAMRKVSLRNLRAHKLRLVLTVLAVVLGTAFVSGALTFRNTMQGSFATIFDNVYVGVDSQIATKRQGAPGIPDAVVDDLTKDKQTLGIDKIVKVYQGGITIAAKDDTALRAGGAPSTISSYVPPSQAIDGNPIVQGAAPNAPPALDPQTLASTPIEALINKEAADRGGLKVGDVTRAIINAAPVKLKIVGITSFTSDSSGLILVEVNQKVAAAMLAQPGFSQSVELTAAAGTTADQLKERISAKIGTEDYSVKTGADLRDDAKQEISSFLDVFSYMLLGFAGIGLLVAIFIIYNTFTMLIMQRVRELALLRAVGVSRPEVLRAVLFEAGVVGLLGGIVGLLAGFGLAAGLYEFLKSGNTGVPKGDLVIGWQPVVGALAVGVFVTMISALVPALRASRIAPVEAMREAQTEGGKPLKVRTIIGIVVLAAGVAAALAGGINESVTFVGLGAPLLLVGMLMVAPALGRPFIGGLGRIVGAPFGKIGRLATTNASRNPRRSAATAFALTLGVMLVVTIGTMGASLKAMFDDVIDKNVTADVIVQGFQGGPLPDGTLGKIQAIDGVDKVVPVQTAMIRLAKDKAIGGGTVAQPGLHDVMPYIMKDGASPDVAANTILVNEDTAKDTGWKAGDKVTLYGPSAGLTADAVVGGTFEASQVLGPWIVGPEIYTKLVPEAQRHDQLILATAKSGTEPDVVKERISEATKNDLDVVVQDRTEFKGQIGSAIDGMVFVLYGMLGLSLLIAVLGIVNTLALSVIERRREIGMLRAVGMFRGQVRRTIYLESLLIAVFGAITGVGLGALLGWTFMKSMREFGFDKTVIPVDTIVVTLVLAVVVGLLAAVWPAVSASRTRALEVISEE